jgi:hypothetical protein
LWIGVFRAPQFDAKFREWDYLYTPHLGFIHRVSPQGEGLWSIEISTEGFQPQKELVEEETQKLFGDAEMIEDLAMHNGHLIPLKEKPFRHTNIFPLGRYAQWESRMTIDKVLKRALEIKDHLEWLKT